MWYVPHVQRVRTRNTDFVFPLKRKGGEWTRHAFGTGKSIDLSVTLTTPGDAEQIQVRVQLRKNNTDDGQVSEPAYVTLNP